MVGYCLRVHTFQHPSERARKRKLVIDGEMKDVLRQLMGRSECDYVFANPQDPTRPLAPWQVENQMGELRKED